jgi:hypothetical protein
MHHALFQEARLVAEVSLVLYRVLAEGARQLFNGDDFPFGDHF